jgi:hypothetical protein
VINTPKKKCLSESGTVSQSVVEAEKAKHASGFGGADRHKTIGALKDIPIPHIIILYISTVGTGEKIIEEDLNVYILYLVIVK